MPPAAESNCGIVSNHLSPPSCETPTNTAVTQTVKLQLFRETILERNKRAANSGRVAALIFHLSLILPGINSSHRATRRLGKRALGLTRFDELTGSARLPGSACRNIATRKLKLNQNATSPASLSTISVRRFFKLAIGKPSVALAARSVPDRVRIPRICFAARCAR